MNHPRSSGSNLRPTWLPAASVPLLAGFSGGVVSTSLLLPLDVIKTRLQVTESSRPDVRFRSFRVLFGIVKYEGIPGLYVGWTPAVLGSAISWGGYFYFYESLKRCLVNYRLHGRFQPTAPTSSILGPPKHNHNTTNLSSSRGNDASAILNSWDNFALACTAGGIMVALTNPVWLVKTRMQLQMRKASEQVQIKPYANMVDAFRTIIREEGALALYKGSGPALLLTSHGGVQFVCYEYLRKHFHYRRLERDEGRGMSVWHRLELSAGYLTMGALSKLVATTTTYPLQLIKSRMQQRSESIELTDEGNVRVVQRQYQGLLATARRIYVKEGFGGFFKGCIPNAIRVAPGAAVTFVVYEEVTDLLG